MYLCLYLRSRSYAVVYVHLSVKRTHFYVCGTHCNTAIICRRRIKLYPEAAYNLKYPLSYKFHQFSTVCDTDYVLHAWNVVHSRKCCAELEHGCRCCCIQIDAVNTFAVRRKTFIGRTTTRLGLARKFRTNITLVYQGMWCTLRSISSVRFFFFYCVIKWYTWYTHFCFPSLFYFCVHYNLHISVHTHTAHRTHATHIHMRFVSTIWHKANCTIIFVWVT